MNGRRQMWSFWLVLKVNANLRNSNFVGDDLIMCAHSTLNSFLFRFSFIQLFVLLALIIFNHLSQWSQFNRFSLLSVPCWMSHDHTHTRSNPTFEVTHDAQIASSRVRLGGSVSNWFHNIFEFTNAFEAAPSMVNANIFARVKWNNCCRLPHGVRVLCQRKTRETKLPHDSDRRPVSLPILMQLHRSVHTKYILCCHLLLLVRCWWISNQNEMENSNPR